MPELFRQEAVGGLAKRKEFSDSTHVFDLYVPR
jgi:hypothetical protein